MRIFNSRSHFKLHDYCFTSESVSEGHPDKICDQISDAILDEYLQYDPNSKVAVECLVAPNNVIISGEITSKHVISKSKIEQVVRDLLKQIGYKGSHFSYKSVKITNLLHKQSPEILKGVEHNGAGDQGIMFGYACDETDELMPAPIYYANKIMQRVIGETKGGILKGLGPDAKCQVTLEYDSKQRPYKAKTIVLSIQHPKNVKQAEIKEVTYNIVKGILPEGWMCGKNEFLLNPSGSFTIGGPQSDTGLTGRKIIVATYGGSAPHGGGAFSGKDPTKVDRSAAYAARYLAKNVVYAGLAKKCLIQISYAIGIAEPISLFLDTYGTATISEDNILQMIKQKMDLTPKGIIRHLELDRPIYLQTATYGHFGRTPTNTGCFSWERLDLLKK